MPPDSGAKKRDGIRRQNGDGICTQSGDGIRTQNEDGPHSQTRTTQVLLGVGQVARMRARSHSVRASPFLVRIPSPFWVRIPYPFWGRIPSPFWGRIPYPFLFRNQSSRFKNRANLERGSRTKNGDGAGIK